MINNSFYTVLNSGERAPIEKKGAVIALGTFDGVHSAHRAIIREAIALKKSIGAPLVGAWCFSELPARVLGKSNATKISTLEDKIQLLLSLGLDFVAVGDFKKICSLSPEEFVDDVLIEQLGALGAVCGFNHRFGKGGAGTSRLLTHRFGADKVKVVPEVTLLGETVSSSAIRYHVAEGEVAIAAKMLERPYSVTAKVVGGKHLGHLLGFPTANIFFENGYLTPKHGIYATLCYTEDGMRHIGVTNVGIRPTVEDGSDSHSLNCETYILNFNKNIYDSILKIEFYEYLREERKFDSLRDLRAQIAEDAERAKEYFASLGIDP